MALDVWIPASTPPAWRTELATLADLHEYRIDSGDAGTLGHGDVLVAGHQTPLAITIIPRLEGLRLIQTLSAGVDRIVDHVPAGVTLCDASGVHDIGVAEWIVMAILASFRHLPQLLEGQREATWRRGSERGDEIAGATVLILGYGSIGRAVEERLRPFGAQFLRVARHPRDGVRPLEDLAGLVSAADVVIVLLPLTSQTDGLVGADILTRMKSGALLVNASRGPVVDTSALTDAVGNGRIRAVLDVTDPEPLPTGHPLWSMAGAVITPHIAGDVRGEEDRAWALVADQLGRLARGEPLRNQVIDGY
jgi:phosphoglycerate dehydrogenase-like enzyme